MKPSGGNPGETGASDVASVQTADAQPVQMSAPLLAQMSAPLPLPRPVPRSERGLAPAGAIVPKGEPLEPSSAEEVNNRINRILQIVKSPSTKAAADGASRTNGRLKPTKRGGARRGGGGGGGTAGGRDAAGGGGADANGCSVGSAAEGPRRGRRGGAGNGSAIVEIDKATSAAMRTGRSAVDGSRERHDDAVDREDAAGYAPNDENAAYGTIDEEEIGKTSLNPGAPVFVPGYWSPDQSAGAAPEEEGDWSFPEVMPGDREGEYIGLQSIAEMGEWVVLRENKPKCPPFFWNMFTGEKTWEAPDSIKEMGVADLLAKWSEQLPERGIQPGPEVWPAPLRGGGKAGQKGANRGSAHTAAASKPAAWEQPPARAPGRIGFKPPPPGFASHGSKPEAPAAADESWSNGGKAAEEDGWWKASGKASGSRERKKSWRPQHETRWAEQDRGAESSAGSQGASGWHAETEARHTNHSRSGKSAGPWPVGGGAKHWQPRAAEANSWDANGWEANGGGAKHGGDSEAGSGAKQWQPRAAASSPEADSWGANGWEAQGATEGGGGGAKQWQTKAAASPPAEAGGGGKQWQPKAAQPPTAGEEAAWPTPQSSAGQVWQPKASLSASTAG